MVVKQKDVILNPERVILNPERVMLNPERVMLNPVLNLIQYWFRIFSAGLFQHLTESKGYETLKRY